MDTRELAGTQDTPVEEGATSHLLRGSDALFRDHPLGAHLRRARTLPDQEAWEESEGSLPVLYISHGAPPLFEDAGWMSELLAWARSMPRPRGILIVSAHWESAPLAISSPEAHTPLVYDFGGFDPNYYQVNYDTPDAHALAGLVRSVLPSGRALYEHPSRGLDHGAWVPLKVMYPDAQIPVLQMSIPTSHPDELITLGGSLRRLREEGVLVIGSGFMTHGLPFINFREPAVIPGWSREFDAWALAALQRGDVDELAAFRTNAPGMPYAHPSVEHFVPLFLSLGASSTPGENIASSIEGWMYGLSRRSLQLG